MLLEEIKFGKYKLFVNIETGKYVLSNQFNADIERMLSDTIDDRIMSKSDTKILDLSVNLTNKCNLRCKYCFRMPREEQYSINYKKVVDLFVDYFPNIEYFKFDMTGDSEPLLVPNKIEEVVGYLRTQETENMKFGFSLCTNGTLLSEKNIEMLKSNNIYYGISLDGNKRNHNKNRVFPNGVGTYNKILSNLKYVDKSYIGAAITLNSDTKGYWKILKKNTANFNYVSMKPVRISSIEQNHELLNNVDAVIEEYNQLTNFLLSTTLNLKTWYILSIIQDDDYFGRILRRVFLNERTINRCGAGINKFAIDGEDIYICGAAIGTSELIVGSVSEGLNQNSIDKIVKSHIVKEQCYSCWAKSICGGPCIVESFNTHNEFDRPVTYKCEITKHLIKLSFHFREEVRIKHNNIYKKILGICRDNHYK